MMHGLAVGMQMSTAAVTNAVTNMGDGKQVASKIDMIEGEVNETKKSIEKTNSRVERLGSKYSACEEVSEDTGRDCKD